ncbi:hypothetical protein J2X72_000746 [Phyllobacterium sp. 1468]|nr:hypothetical protein [Phyllobacterium sp. 1468]
MRSDGRLGSNHRILRGVSPERSVSWKLVAADRSNRRSVRYEPDETTASPLRMMLKNFAKSLETSASQNYNFDHPNKSKCYPTLITWAQFVILQGVAKDGRIDSKNLCQSSSSTGAPKANQGPNGSRLLSTSNNLGNPAQGQGRLHETPRKIIGKSLSKFWRNS